MKFPRTQVLILLTIGLLGGFVLIGCVPPGGMLSTSGCRVLQPLEQSLPVHARIRVRVDGPAGPGSASFTDSLSAAESFEPQVAPAFFPELQVALVEALATSEGLLLEVVGWEELSAYRSYLKNKQQDQTRDEWEFGTGDNGEGQSIDLAKLVTPELWASCPYEVVAEVLDYNLVNMSYQNPATGTYGTLPSQEATIHVRLVELGGGETLMAVSIPVRGDDIFQKAARSFALELERQFWQVREGKPIPVDRL